MNDTLPPALQPALPTFGRQDRAIPTYLFHALNTILRERGLNTNKLTAYTGIDTAELEQQDTLISFDQSEIIIRNALQLSGDPALGMTVGSRENLNDLGMMGYAIASSKNGWDAMRIIDSYFQTTTNLTKIEITLNKDECSRKSTPTHPVEPELFRFLVEEDLSGHVKFARDYLGNEYAPLEVHFAYPQPDYVQQYQDFFRCPLVFETEVSKLLFDEKTLDIRNPSYNPVTESLALKLCDEILAQQDSQRSLVGKVHLALLRNPDNFPSTQEVAKQLGMSERSLRRRLKELDTSYKEIFNDVRKEIALRYLRTTNLELEDIAQLVGFSDGSSFYRFFKKWTGKAPSAYRN